MNLTDITPSSSSTICPSCNFSVRPDELKDAVQTREPYTDGNGILRVRLQYAHGGECGAHEAARWNSANKATTLVGAK